MANTLDIKSIEPVGPIPKMQLPPGFRDRVSAKTVIARMNAHPFEHTPEVDKIFMENNAHTDRRAALLKIDLTENFPITLQPRDETITVTDSGGFITPNNSEFLITEGVNITNGVWRHKVEEDSGPIWIKGPNGNEIIFDGSFPKTQHDPKVHLDFHEGEMSVDCSDFVVPEGWTIHPMSRAANPRWMRRNLIIKVRSRGSIVVNVPKNEAVAIETLREMISEAEFRKYVKYGFVLVQGLSGATYQVFRNQAHTKVWKGGKVVEEVCVRLGGLKIPLTDNVIAFKAMIEANEEEFKKSGNVYKMGRVA